MNRPPGGGIRNGLSVDLEDLEASVRQPLGMPPHPASDYVARHTVQLLALFREYGVRATFFVNAQSIEHDPDLLDRIVEDGHELAAHGYTHRFLSSYRSPHEF